MKRLEHDLLGEKELSVNCYYGIQTQRAVENFAISGIPISATPSLIMPGKVNPVIPEIVKQIAYQVIGADVTISFASEAGQLELNVMEPLPLFVTYITFRVFVFRYKR